LLFFDHPEKVSNWRRIEELEKPGFHLGLLVETRQRELVLSLRMHGKIRDGESGSLVRRRVYTQQQLIRELIAGGRSGVPKGNIQDVTFWIVGETGTLHRILPPLPTNGVTRQNKVVCPPVRINVKAYDHNDGRVPVEEVRVVPIIQIHIRPYGILKSPPSADGFEHAPSVVLDFRMLFADMLPAFIGQINLMASLVSDGATHQQCSAFSYYT
jgi:hypothetical protein